MRPTNKHEKDVVTGGQSYVLMNNINSILYNVTTTYVNKDLVC